MARTPVDRESIFQALSDAHAPLTAKELAQRVPGAHVSTVYRALTHYTKRAEVREVHLGGVTRFEVCGDHHHHIVCTSCGTSEDVHYEPRGLDQETLKHSRTFSSIQYHALNFYGLCKQCQ